MRNAFLLIFSCLVSVCSAQLIDDFSDGNFTSNPPWTGSTSDFSVNSALELQLNASAAGTSWLSTPINLSLLDTLEWGFRIKLDFAPSSSNYSRVYLNVDQPDPDQPLNGYFLQFGEALSLDAIELFRQSGTVTTSVCRGLDAQIAAAFDLRIKVFRTPNGSWEIYTAPGNGGSYSLISTGNDLGNQAGQYFTFRCTYTSGNINRFHLDDVYAGAFIPDLEKPTVGSFTVNSDSSLAISFSEKLQNSPALLPANYSLSSIGVPDQIQVDSINDYTINLFYHQYFVSGNHYSLSIHDLFDRAGNRMNDTTLQFDYYPISKGCKDDVVFSEIYFEPSSLSPLPNAEFSELFNRSDSAIDLTNWSLSDGSSTATFPKLFLPPKSYLLVTDLSNETLFSNVSNHISLDHFPGLNNDTGDTLTLMNASGELITTLIFNDDSYHDSQKKNGGWTIERVDENYSCDAIANWKASIAPGHGTMAAINSVAGFFTDEESPFIQNVYVKDSSLLEIQFSEELFSTINSSNFSAIDNTMISNDCINVLKIGSRKYELTFMHPFDASVWRLKINSSLTDCAGNMLDTLRFFRLGKAAPALSGDVVINELLFDAPVGCQDFVELFNCSSKIIDLYRWLITENDAVDSTHIKEQALISSDHRLLFPDEYLVLTRDPDALRQKFFCPFRERILSVSDLPDYNADKGRAVINDLTGNPIDEMYFADTMHFYLLNSPKGVSLERLNGYHGERSNVQWHSAASTVGFATPTYRNSQWIGGNTPSGSLEVANEVFSPDNNGFEDLLAINYHFDLPGILLSIQIFDTEGVPVKKLIENESVASEGQIYWDGFTDVGRIALPGRYLVWAKTFNENGESHVYRTSCVIAVE